MLHVLISPLSAPISVQLAPDEPGVLRAPDRAGGDPHRTGGGQAQGMDAGEGDLPHPGIHHDLHG